jgi:hypothetical protein
VFRKFKKPLYFRCYSDFARSMRRGSAHHNVSARKAHQAAGKAGTNKH